MRKTNSRKLIEHEGKKRTLLGWSRESGIPTAEILNRLENGWTFSNAITLPLGDPKQLEKQKARQLADMIVSDILEVYREVGSEEFKRQLKEAYLENAPKVVKDFERFYSLPKTEPASNSGSPQVTYAYQFNGISEADMKGLKPIGG